MQVIPVIDLKGGVAVHAKQGRRDAYLPIHTALCPSADIFDVAEAYLELYDFRTFYIADLDALEGKGSHEALIHAAAERFPNRNFWLDRGLPLSAPASRRPSNLKTVLGSESFRTETLSLLDTYAKDFVLSLDFRGMRLGAESLFTNPEYWPNDIIIMTLERVGSDSGPDIEKLAAFRKAYPGKNFIAAGGIRNREDLAALQKIGIQQALVASALHSGAIGRADLAAL
ncbi:MULTISPECIES: HisA/HisF-related TIM barrel protein [Methylomicrobium]|uniref:HisA/hisF family protein n=1 Tax=Methylomicrobium album BG8 TaxID=686340 RepID=H8GG88_METAL|nr:MULTISPECIES: HisA/HisF-related TIM barrel protein [Methylomicrobium]EIC31168.1 hisA/hisF family protein [Methylomicrobium album BG8]